MSTIYDFSADSLAGIPVNLDQYKGQVVLIVNTASKCGFTCNQFGGQEPGQAEEIGAFCEKNFGVSFPLFAKIDVNGANAHPLFKQLKKDAPGILGTEAIKWNFTKFLIRKNGTVYQRYAPATKPEELVADIEKLLAE